MAPVRSSDPFPLPPTELHCTVCLLPFLSPPRCVFPVHVHTNHTDVSDRCVSRCLCGQSREFAAVSFLSGPAKRDGAGILLTPLNKKTKQKKVCCSKPDKKPNQGKFPTASLSGIHLTFQLLLDSSLSSFLQPTLFSFSFFLSNFDSCRSGHPRWLRQTDTKRRFDMMMARVIVLFQSFGEKGEPVCAQSPAAIVQAKICIEAEMGEVLYNNLTDSRQISYVVSASEETVPLSFQFQ